MSDPMKKLLTERLAEWWTPTEDALEKLAAHYALMLKWNEKMNLTRVTDLAEAVERHYAESVWCALQLPPDLASVADIGSGPGFPGVGIAAARPACRVTLVESDQRKAAFLKESTRGWGNVDVLAKRAEAIRDRHWDALTARAVRPADVRALLPRLAPAAYLLVGEPDAGAERIRLPWGESRYLSIERA
jgi:16S rRNA (guanine527-N7)-methyltransferase